MSLITLHTVKGEILTTWNVCIERQHQRVLMDRLSGLI